MRDGRFVRKDGDEKAAMALIGGMNAQVVLLGTRLGAEFECSAGSVEFMCLAKSGAIENPLSRQPAARAARCTTCVPAPIHLLERFSYGDPGCSPAT